MKNKTIYLDFPETHTLFPCPVIPLHSRRERGKGQEGGNERWRREHMNSMLSRSPSHSHFLIATSSPVSLTLARLTEPNVPSPSCFME